MRLTKFPYLSQLDNLNNPYGSCNVTSCAMVLNHYGIKGSGRGQLEDQLYRWLVDRGLSRHSPYDLERLINEVGAPYNIKDSFTSRATWDEVNAHIDSGKPIISHGYFTRFGHIIVVWSRNEQGYIVHDPYGECCYDHASGRTWYETNKSGEGLQYSYRMMRSLCGPDGDNWVHFCSRG